MRKLKVTLAIAMIFCLMGANAALAAPGCPNCYAIMVPDSHYGTYTFNGNTEFPCPNHGAIHERRQYERYVDTYDACNSCGLHIYKGSYLQYTYGHPNL